MNVGETITVPSGDLAGQRGKVVSIDGDVVTVRVALGEGRHAYDDIIL